jgi:hypothetical protein
MRTRNESLRTRQGQTIIIAMIVLGVLLIVGFVFLGIVARNVRSTAAAQTRSEARELADAALSFAHNQMLTSPLGADWRPAVTYLQPVAGFPDRTLDPDVLYLRPPSGVGWRSDADTQKDQGGPDGLGPYSRIDFPGGRALVRVRFAPSDANLFSNTPSGPLRNPGRARTYTIIEAVGRPGRVIFNDPTTLGTNQAVQFQGFADSATLSAAIASMKTADHQLTQRSAKAMAFASIGLIESARFVTNANKESRAAEIGIDTEMGAVYRGVKVSTGRLLSDNSPVSSPLSLQLGTAEQLFDLGSPPVPTTGSIGFGGTMVVNGDLRVHGDLYLMMNRHLGDTVTVAGTMLGADPDARMNVEVNDVDAAGVWIAPTLIQLQNATNPSLNSRSQDFSTLQGLIKDGITVSDTQNHPRGVGRKEPPSITAVDSETSQNRYLTMTRESGILMPSGYSGRFGHGQGVYINNIADRQVRFDDAGREIVATAESQVYDWLNPNNGQLGSGWEGPFYRPRAALVMFTLDGFVIFRDPRGPETQTWWRGPDGNIGVNKAGVAEQRHDIRFRIGYDSNGVKRIINTFTPDPASPSQAIDIDANPPNFDAGQPFNGVMYFEGNVRVRGVIPTDEQISLVSNASIYIDGSITKGVQFFDGSILNRPSRSLLGLFARDFVVINTTQFFGAAAGQELEEADDRQSALAYNPIRSRASTLTFATEMLLDPTGNPDDPTTWTPYAHNYREFNGETVDDGAPLDARLYLTHASDDGPAPAAFFQLDVNEGLGSPPLTNTAPTSLDGSTLYNHWDYLFGLTDHNAATQPYADFYDPDPLFVPDYGLGVEAWQRYPRFESIGFPLVSNDFLFDPAFQLLYAPGGDDTRGAYGLSSQSQNFLKIWSGTSNTGLPSENYLLARAGIAPHDVRIEAVMFAEQGSFFVIPGPSFNPNPNDRWEVFEQAVNDFGGFTSNTAVQQAQRERLENFGTFPETPFFGEPLDVRITIVGAITENMPQPMSVQARWLEKWGWIPRQIGGLYDFNGAEPRPVLIPKAHVPPGYEIRPSEVGSELYVPNMIMAYDPVLSTATVGGFSAPMDQVVRTHWVDFDNDDVIDPGEEYVLPPLPRLPVSPKLSYFGEVTQ